MCRIILKIITCSLDENIKYNREIYVANIVATARADVNIKRFLLSRKLSMEKKQFTSNNNIKISWCRNHYIVNVRHPCWAVVVVLENGKKKATP